MPAERRQQPGRDLLRGEPRRDLAGDFEQSLASRAHIELALRLPKRGPARYRRILFRLRRRQSVRTPSPLGRVAASAHTPSHIETSARKRVKDGSATLRRSHRGCMRARALAIVPMWNIRRTYASL